MSSFLQHPTGGLSFSYANKTDVDGILTLLRQERSLFPFLPRTVIENAVQEQELLVCKSGGSLLGFVRYHHRKDGVTTLHEIAVAPESRGLGIGRRLVESLVAESARCGQFLLRLKCPIELPANGFYAHLGFTRVTVEDGKHRPLVVWEKLVEGHVTTPTAGVSFFISLTHDIGETRQVIRLWDESGDPRNPFSHVIFAPSFVSPIVCDTVRQLKEERVNVVMFDSGGYQVQTGKATYAELFDFLLHCYQKNTWADWYVLPDHVPRSTDSDSEVEFKVRETIDFARIFIQRMPDDFVEKAVGVVHGRTAEQVRCCVEAYAGMGVKYLGFGSFGTSGPKGMVNLISQGSLRLLKLVQTLAREHNMRIHIFGIGTPSYLIRLAEANIIPTSFDSAGWWKAGGFGKIFFPAGQQLHITIVPPIDFMFKGIERQKKESGHECVFCSDLKGLRKSRINRIMHNLAAMLDTVDYMNRDNYWAKKSGQLAFSI